MESIPLMKTTLFFALLLFLGLSHLQGQEDFTKIESQNFKNLYRISDDVYRSEQPNKKGFRELESFGIKTVINFRRRHDDTKKAKGVDLIFEKIPLKAKELQESDIIEVLRMIRDANKPVLIHCFHGSDRTGVISASYRVVFEDWPKNKAIEEMRFKDFGYHEKWYPMLVDIIENLDTEKIKRELNLK